MADPKLVVQIGGDASGLAAALDHASAKIGNFTKAVERKFDMRALVTGLAVALGVNIQNIAEQVARFFTGVTKKAEQDLKDLADASTRAADSTIEAMRGRLDNGQKLQLLLQEEERLTKRIAENEGVTTAQTTQRLNDISRLNALKKEEADLQERINREAAVQELSGRRAREMLEKFKTDSAEAEREENERIFKEEREWLSEREKLEARIVEQKKAAASETEKLMMIEREQAALKAQQQKTEPASNEFIKIQIRINDLEAERLGILGDIKAKEDEITAAKNEQLAAAEKIYRGAEMFATSKIFSQNSDAELKEKLRRNNQKAQEIGVPGASDLGNAIQLGMTTAESENIRRELEFRNKLRRDYQFGGEAMARRNFAGDPLAFDRVLQQVLGQFGTGEKQLEESRKQTRLLEKIVPPAGVGGRG